MKRTRHVRYKDDYRFFLLRINIASHPDVLLARHAILTSIIQSSSLLRGEGTRDKAQRTSAREASINIIEKPKGN